MSKEEFRGVVGMYNRITAKQEAMYWTTKQKKALIELEIAEAKKTKLMADLKAQRHIDSGKPKPKAHDIVIVETKDQRQAESLCNLFDAINIAIGENEQFDIKINQVGSLVSLSILSGLPDFKVAK